MDDSTLDKLFSDNLKEEQDFDFREEDWTELSDRLEGQSKKRFAWWWIAATGVLLFSIGLNIWQTYNIKKLNSNITELQNTIHQQLNNSGTENKKEGTTNQTTLPPTAKNIVQKDTIVKTLYRTIIEEKEVPVYIYVDKKTEKEDASNNSKNQQKLTPTTIQSYEDLYAAKAQPLIEDQPIEQNRLDLLSPLPLATLDLPEEKNILNLGILKNTPPIRPLNTNKWWLGVTGSQAWIPNKNCRKQNNWSAGIAANYHLSKNWTLRGSYTFNRIKAICLTDANPIIDSNSINPAADFSVLSNLFEYEQDGDNLVQSYIRNEPISNIQSRQNYLQFSVGAQYRLPKSFFVSTSILGYHNLSRKNLYNASLSSEQEKYAQSVTELTGGSNATNPYSSLSQKSGLMIDRIEIGLGKEFHLKKKWLMPVEFYYQTNLNTVDFALPTLIGLKASFLRKL